MRKNSSSVLVLLVLAILCSAAVVTDRDTAYADVHKDAINTILSGRTFEGMCYEKGGESWPFRIHFKRIDGKNLEGVMEWPTLNSIHKVEGEYGYGTITFEEVSALRKGQAELGGVYKLNFNPNSNVMEGTFCDDRGRELGKASFSLSY